jgi:predicted RNA binding protein YcfA (HicA-like mRNA interferase family)
MQVTSKDLIKYALFLEWYEVSQEGSHKQFKHVSIKGKVTIPHPKMSMAPKTISSVLKQLGKTKEEFEQWING